MAKAYYICRGVEKERNVLFVVRFSVASIVEIVSRKTVCILAGHPVHSEDRCVKSDRGKNGQVTS